jgi:hypothetical protein
MSILYPFRLVKIDGRGYQPFITFFHGEKSYNALIDSGASNSFLNETFFEDGLKEEVSFSAVGMESGFSVWAATPDTINLSGIHLTNFMLLKTDLSYINQSLTAFEFAPVDGIFGCDLLQHLKATINFKKRQLIFHDSKQIHPLFSEGDMFFSITLTLNNKPLRFLLDTGASQSLLDFPVAEILFPENITCWEINHGPSIGISSDDIINTNRSMSITFDNSGADDVPHFERCFTALQMNKINHTFQSVGLPAVDAILGIDFLKKFCKIIDFENFIYLLKKNVPLSIKNDV